ncbi:DUF2793 domain-containing protein [Chachezhania sediminis]|uniref:DUF2793 domain-containing protein n=1 Tax=Chachezhania sediminis TaxID=2599291 RepID=UPI00131D2F7F|nr:DUF2793 domain-containing protein [Chachezhania sediminis]
MPDQSSPRLALPLLQGSQAQKHVTVNEALSRLDLVVQMQLQAVDATVPPGSPAEGEAHGVGIGATGAWAGQDSKVAAWLAGGWEFLVPAAGWLAWDVADAAVKVWDGTAWTLIEADADNLSGIGIGTTSDATNRLAVSAPATLLSHAGDDHRVKVNKAAAGDTAALLFQSGWTGHAEIGLAGNTDLSVKVSADGSTWTSALVVDATDGTVTGAGVQGSATDTTAGRLMATGAFGLGETGAPPLLDDFDATGTASGFYRMTAATANRPTGPSTGAVAVLRQGSGGFVQMVAFSDGTGATRHHDGTSFTGWSISYGSANLLGTVSQSGGTPTGGVIERGSNANGQYVRFADGTQICTNANAAITTAPAAFSGTITKIDGDKLWIGTWF